MKACRWWCTIVVLLCGFVVAQGQKNPVTRMEDVADPAARDSLDQGKSAFDHRQYDEAIKKYKDALKRIGPECALCLERLTDAYYQVKAYKSAIETSNQLQKIATDKSLLARSHNSKGLSELALAEDNAGKDKGKLKEAEADFRATLELDPHLDGAHFNLGLALLKQNHDEEGKKALQDYLDTHPKEEFAEQAREMIENPRRAREPFAPDFSVTLSDGQYISLSDLHGKVVLLDFWATWCPPCVSSVGDLKRLAHRREKDKFVILSISADNDEEKWRDFLQKNQMTWPQYFDRSGKVRRLFEVNAFPTYIVIDADGVMQRLSVGNSPWGLQFEDVIKKCLDIAAKQEKAQAAAEQPGK